MANTKLPPTPTGVPPGHSFWNDWYERLRNIVNSTLVNHNDLQNIQGGGATERFHLTTGQHSSLTGGGDSAQHFHSSDRARANHTGTQTLSTISDVTITATNLNSLDDGVDSTLHFHASDRARANHTGTQDHNTTLSGFQGGSASERFHLTSAEHTGTGTGSFVRETSPTLTTPKATTTIGVGNTTPSASGAGISFPSTQSASSDANTLDDYEEGTFTPALAFGGGSTGITYSVQEGSYTKIGRLVSGRFIIVLTNKGSSTGDATITGLPFTNGADLGSATTEFASNFNTAIPEHGYVNGTATSINIWFPGTTTITLVNETHFNNNSRLDMWFTYQV